MWNLQWTLAVWLTLTASIVNAAGDSIPESPLTVKDRLPFLMPDDFEDLDLQ